MRCTNVGFYYNTLYKFVRFYKSLLPLSWTHYRTLIQVDDAERSEGDNPTIGIVLCSDTDEDIARYSVLHGNEQLFATKYKLYLPT